MMWTRSSYGHFRPKIAVVGGGIAGLSAAWLLRQNCDVTVFESQPRLGGHANTVDVDLGGRRVAVDTGFIVYNERNYPNFTALLAHLGVASEPSNMSFAASLDDGKFEYSSVGLGGLLGNGENIVNLRLWRMIWALQRFYRQAPFVLGQPTPCELTIGDYLSREGYSDSFASDHLMPMAAAIWSASVQDIRQLPLLTFLRFFMSHGLLELKGRPKWRTISGGSRSYVDRLVAPLQGHIATSRAVARVQRAQDHVTVVDRAGRSENFDQVVMAAHADQSLDLLVDADLREREILGAFGYTPNRAVLHTDTRMMPRRRRAWASWNYVDRAGASGPLCVTYWMNRLQNLDLPLPVLITLNPDMEIAPGKIIRSFDYAHPQFNSAAIDAQSRLWQLQGNRRTWFCGSYFGYGFHEDALESGLAVAESIGGIERPWSTSSTSRIAEAPTPARVY